AWSRSGFQRTLPRIGRPRFKFVFRGRAADYGPAVQGVLEPDSNELRAVDGGHLGRAARGVWRQDVPGDPGDDAVGPGRDASDRFGERLVWDVRFGDGLGRPELWRGELGEFFRAGWTEHGPLSGSAGVHGVPRQGQRVQLL